MQFLKTLCGRLKQVVLQLLAVAVHLIGLHTVLTNDTTLDFMLITAVDVLQRRNAGTL